MGKLTGVRVNIIYDSPEGIRRQAEKGEGAVILCARDNGDMAVRSYGKYSELLVLGAALELSQARFDRFKDDYLRSLLAQGMDVFACMARETADRMCARLDDHEEQPLPATDPRV